jgi:thymidylate kinase
MLIILEGNECNFKSTVAEKLSNLIGFNVVKGSSFEMSKTTNEELFNKFNQLSNLNRTIIDRFIYSNLVYASLYKDYSILTKEQVKEIECKLLQKNSLVVYLFAEAEVIKKRLLERGDNYVKVDEVKAINEKYEEVLKGARLPVLHMNTEFVTSNMIAHIVSKMVTQRMEE